MTRVNDLDSGLLADEFGGTYYLADPDNYNAYLSTETPLQLRRWR